MIQLILMANPITTLEELADKLEVGARELQEDESADLPTLYFRLAKRQEATETNPRRSGPNRLYPSKDGSWPLIVEGRPPVQAVIAAIASDPDNKGEVKGNFSFIYLREVVGDGGAKRMEKIGQTVAELAIGRASDAAPLAPAAAAKDLLPEQIGPRAAESLHNIFVKREDQVAAVEALRLKHDSTTGAGVERMVKLLGDMAVNLNLSIENQMKHANSATRAAVEITETAERQATAVNRLSEALQTGAKSVQLLADASYERQKGVLLPKEGPGAMAQFFGGLKDLLKEAVPFLPVLAPGLMPAALAAMGQAPAPGAGDAAPAAAAPTAAAPAPAPPAPAPAPAPPAPAPAPPAPAPAPAPAPPAPAETERLEAERLKARLDAGLDPAVAVGVGALKEAGYLSAEDVGAIVDQRLAVLQASFAPLLEKLGPVLAALGTTAAPVEPPAAADVAAQKGESE